MDELRATGVMILLFALRCVVPLVFTIGLGYLMNRLVDRWEAEEELARQQKPEIGLQPAVTAEEKQSGIKIPCWVLRNCDPEKRENCSAYQQRQFPCWVARIRSDGALPSNCPDCPVYNEALKPA